MAKKIMFSDKFGLTKAVLEGRKTQTRRIVKCHIEAPIIETEADLWKVKKGDTKDLQKMEAFGYSRYEIGEEVAVAQTYFDCGTKWAREHIDIASDLIKQAGYKNKMFVRADLMPHRIKITNIRIERLQDISDEDCLKEGISFDEGIFYFGEGYNRFQYYDIKKTFSKLIDKVSGKGTWDSNPYVFVYDFELLK